MRILHFLCVYIFSSVWFNGFSQEIGAKLQEAFTIFEKDEQLKYGISSLCVYDAKTGKMVFEKNSAIGLAPASTQKIFTAIASFDFLGQMFTFKTDWFVDAANNVYINPSGDPTFGSSRYAMTKPDVLLKQMFGELKKRKINSIDGIKILTDTTLYTVPDGWIWEDIGNYYGAGNGSLNWRENQYDIYLQSGSKVGDPCKIVRMDPAIDSFTLDCRLKSASKGTGDNAYIFAAPGSDKGFINGTIPVNEGNFKISGAIPVPYNSFMADVKRIAMQEKVSVSPTAIVKKNVAKEPLFTTYSPALDSIVYWFLQKSINLYGEALIKKIAEKKCGIATTDSGVAVLKQFYKDRGIDERALNLNDGSGLSPLNRVTTYAQVLALLYARKAAWYSSFYNSLPLYNGIKMKSGTINNVKAFCGYHTSASGRQYVFSFLVNNYNGSSSTLVQKMYTVLNTLK